MGGSSLRPWADTLQMWEMHNPMGDGIGSQTTSEDSDAQPSDRHSLTNVLDIPILALLHHHSHPVPQRGQIRTPDLCRSRQGSSIPVLAALLEIDNVRSHPQRWYRSGPIGRSPRSL